MNQNIESNNKNDDLQLSDQEIKYSEEIEVDKEMQDQQDSGMMAMAMAEPSTINDPKEYVETPFGYNCSGNEFVCLNNGSLTYTVTDFVLPGRDGHDLVVKRRYDSSSANTQDSYIDSSGNSYTTKARLNDHDTSIYGLGQGWSFCFSSIESVYDSLNICYHDFLHLGNGQKYKIDLTSVSGLKDYPLTDIKLEKKSGTSPVAYDYILSHKDGSKEYFQLYYSSGTQLSTIKAIEDRFGNLIEFKFLGSDGITIIPTVGDAISLIKSGTGFKWMLPENKTVEYTISDNKMVKSKNQLGLETQYSYTVQTANHNLVGDLGGSGVTISHVNLTSITYPTGAKSQYTFSQLNKKTQYGSLDSFVLSSRKDVSAANQNYNEESYSYLTTYDSSKQSSYISQTAVTKGWGTVAFRVKAYDTLDLESVYATSPTRTIINN